MHSIFKDRETTDLSRTNFSVTVQSTGFTAGANNSGQILNKMVNYKMLSYFTNEKGEFKQQRMQFIRIFNSQFITFCNKKMFTYPLVA